MSNIETDVPDSSLETPSAEIQGGTEPAASMNSGEATESIPQGNPPLPTSATVKDALAYLTGDSEKTVDNSKTEKTEPAPVKPAETVKAKEPEKTPTPPSEAFEGLDTSRLKAKTQERIHSLWERSTKAETALKQAEPDISHGKELRDLLERHRLHDDYKAVHKDTVAGAIKFQAALDRAASGKASAHDVQFLQATFAGFDQSRAQLGMQTPAAGIGSDVLAEVEAFLQKEVSSYRMEVESAEALLAQLKAKAAPKAPPAPVAPAPTPQPVAQQQQPPVAEPEVDDDPALAFYDAQLRSDLAAAGHKEQEAMATLVQKVLLPPVLSQLSQRLPGRNPGQVFDALPPQERYRLLADALKTHQAKQQSIQPKRPASTTTRPSPINSAGATQTPGNPPRSNSQAAINYLTGE